MNKVHLPECGEEVVIYDVHNYPYVRHMDAKTVRKRKITYYNLAASYDIESTTMRCPHMEVCERMRIGECDQCECEHWIEPNAYMYQWQVCIEDDVIFGRTWNEFLEFYRKMHEVYSLSKYRRIVIYVHNLSYEFQFFRNIIPIDSVLATDRNRILTCLSNGIEFRCSYRLSNMSLEKFCQNTEGVVHGKKSGNLDYNIIRTPETPLTDSEKEYCYCDVKGLTECIQSLLKNDTIVSIPLTSTGYVRRDCRSRMQDNFRNVRRFRKEALTPRQYLLCREAFRGGDTHANGDYVGQIITGVGSYDKASSYPWQIMSKKYPGKFIEGNSNSIDEYIKCDYACLMVVRFSDVTYIGQEGMPYIPYAKCRMMDDSSYVNDNGRIIYASVIEMTITEVDYKIILKDYDIENVEILEIHISKKSYLPLELRQSVMDYFEKKCRLKDIDGMEYEYAKSKNRLNAIYGMMVTDIIRQAWEYDEGEWNVEEPDVESALKKYYSNRNSFLSYQWGVWVTAYAREELKECQRLVGCDCVYTDTDSVKYCGDHHEAFADYNAGIIKMIEKLPIAPKVVCGDKVYYMGVMENEGEYSEFRTWGAKKYAWKKEKNGKEVYRTVVSGLGIKEGSRYVETNGLESFTRETVFFPSGRNTLHYVDRPPHYITVGSSRFLTASGIAMVPTTYTLDINREFSTFLIDREQMF